MSTFVRVDGIEALQNTFNNVAPRVARNLMRATVQQIASNIAKDAKINAPVLSGNLKKAIKAKRKKSEPNTPTSVVYIEQGKDSKNDAFYWRFVEFGTRGYSKGDGRAGGNGKAKRNIPARPPAPFIEPAKKKAQGDMSRMLREEFGKKLEKHLAREAKRSGQ